MRISRSLASIPNALLLIAALAAPVAAAEKPNFSGDWTMSLEKSNFGPLPAPTSTTLKITHAEPSLTIVTDTKGGFAGDEYSERIYTTDGTPLAFDSGGAQVKTVLTWEGEAMVFANDIATAEGFNLSSKATMTLIDGGKTIRQVIHVDAPEPVGAFDMLYVFDKR